MAVPPLLSDLHELPALEWSGQPEAIFEGTIREALEQSVLPAFLRAQRWFGGKARPVESVQLQDWGTLPADGPAHAFLVLLRVVFTQGASDLYFMPLGVTDDPPATAMREAQRPWLLAQLKGPRGDALIHDALADDAVCTALLRAVGAGQEFATRKGRVRGLATTAFAELRGDPAEPLAVVRGPATSSNSLVFYGRRLLFKLFRRLEPGINPDFEIGRFLTERSIFDRIPRTAGALEYQCADDPTVTLGILQAFVPNQADGWKHALDELARYFERVSGSVPPDPRPLTDLAEADPPSTAQEAIGDYLHAAGTLGRRTAELHRALAADRRDPSFAPEPLTVADLAALDADIIDQGQTALAALRHHIGQLADAVASEGRRLLDEGPKTLDRLKGAAPPRLEVAKVRCHGDYHLGQVLWVDNDFILLDFEGEPTRTVEERRAKQSPLKDVAGMLRSFHYAAYAGLFAYTRDRPHDFDRLEPWADLWFRWCSAEFLRDYRVAAGQAIFLPAEAPRFVALLDAFMLDKAFYELAYELNNRPDWVRIPLRGILALLEQEP